MRQRLQLVLILGALSAFGPLSIDFYLPGLPRLTRDFDAGASAGQLTLTACVLGLAFGQLLAGPLSDRLGRRPPLLVGLVAYCVASLLCAVAPSIWILIGLRFVQGLGGGAGLVVARSIVRDLRSGDEAARLFSILMLVTGLVPILAPIVGGQLLEVTSWRGLFVILAAVDALILVGTIFWLPETLPAERRRAGGEAVTAFGELVRDRLFLAYAIVLALGFAQMFSYIAGSSFVLQDLYGLSAQEYGAIFGLNALGIVAASQLNGALVRRVGAERMLAAGMVTGTAAGVTLLVIVLAGGAGLAGILPCLFVSVSSVGITLPNATALALTDYPHAAGSASAVLGTFQFAVGGLAAPLVGAAGQDTAVPMAAMIAAFGIAALGAVGIAHRTATTRRHPVEPAPVVTL
jgi:DHA1 family bicyclomycin/chloramphenicol resistance-like MFS transporter